MELFSAKGPRGFWGAGLAAAAIFFGAGAANASLIYNTSLIDPPGTYYGTGNPNTNWTVNRNNGVEVGLQTLTRYVGSVAPTAGTNIYHVATGPTSVSGKSGSAWGFAFSLNLSGANLTLNDVTTSLMLQDVANGTTGAFDALLIPDNYGYSSAGRDGGSTANPLNPNIDYGAQNAEALSYSSIATAFNDAGYNMNQNDTYNFLFSVSCKTGTECSGQQLASVSSTVIAGTGAHAVPEPSGLGMFILGVLAMLGLGWLGRRRADSPALHTV